jgi:acyl-CoA hydrolase
MNTIRSKTPRESQMETRYLLMPHQANDLGIAFGGTIMSWIDMLAAMVAQKHCGRKVVTVSTDKISFLAPVHIGDHVVLRASVNHVGTTSMEVGVQVSRENPYTGESVRATTAYLTLVGVDEHEHPAAVPPLRPETPDEIRRFENARLRVQARKELVAKLKLKPK